MLRCTPRMAGLSPRVRGNRDRVYVKSLTRGSIPACAGEPQRLQPNRSLFQVYPRVCGGTQQTAGRNLYHLGLSPRVRGNLARTWRASWARRSIPACAGEPVGFPSPYEGNRVYPRVCGGTDSRSTPLQTPPGLSPRVRGNRQRLRRRTDGRGSIPACAGEPAVSMAAWMRASVYPRVCGGTYYITIKICCQAGLSPRVRGNRNVDLPRTVGIGSIPACAGEPRTPGALASRSRVYPRVCGGTRCAAPSLVGLWGLSPRVRGNRNRHIVTYVAVGSIPACAGEPLRCGSRCRLARVYPRVCGGTIDRIPSMFGFLGLSPRVRGNH